METAEMPELLTVAEVCAMTRQSKTSVHREIEANEFDVKRIGPKRGSIRVTRASVEAYLSRRTITAPAAA
jgi:predicted DNA-binding transcriptional regulator AlpA